MWKDGAREQDVEGLHARGMRRGGTLAVRAAPVGGLDLDVTVAQHLVPLPCDLRRMGHRENKKDRNTPTGVRQ
jgi:hypothetical protein